MGNRNLRSRIFVTVVNFGALEDRCHINIPVPDKPQPNLPVYNSRRCWWANVTSHKAECRRRERGIPYLVLQQSSISVTTVSYKQYRTAGKETSNKRGR